MKESSEHNRFETLFTLDNHHKCVGFKPATYSTSELKQPITNQTQVTVNYLFQSVTQSLKQMLETLVYSFIEVQNNLFLSQ